MNSITNKFVERWKVPSLEYDGDYHHLGPEPVTGFIYRLVNPVGERLEQVPHDNPEIPPGRYVIIPYPKGIPSDAREIHYSGVRRLVGAGAHWLPTVCVDTRNLYLLARREQFLHNQRIIPLTLNRLGRRFLVWIAYCWRTESYRYALSTPSGVPMGSGWVRVTLPTSPRVGDDDFHRAQNEIVESVVGELTDWILRWETDPAPNLLSRIVSRVPTVVNDTEAYTKSPTVGIATPPEGWASWSDEEDRDFLDRFGWAWMRGEPIPCGRISR